MALILRMTGGKWYQQCETPRKVHLFDLRGILHHRSEKRVRGFEWYVRC